MNNITNLTDWKRERGRESEREESLFLYHLTRAGEKSLTREPLMRTLQTPSLPSSTPTFSLAEITRVCL